MHYTSFYAKFASLCNFCFEKEKRRRCAFQLLFCVFSFAYSSDGAPTGQTSAQEPQLMHSSALITYLPSPSLIALTGQPSAHAPHIMQSSLITYAISITSLFNIVPSLYHIVLKMYSVFDKFLVQNRFYVVRDVGAHVAVLLMLFCVD